MHQAKVTMATKSIFIGLLFLPSIASAFNCEGPALEAFKSAAFHLARVNSYCVGCKDSPYATEEWLRAERAEAQTKHDEAAAACEKDMVARSNAEREIEKIRRENEKIEKLELSCARRNRIEKGTVRLGMTSSDVILCGWGKPQKINSSVNSVGTNEQWVYNNEYLYFRNGRLTSWQTSR